MTGSPDSALGYRLLDPRPLQAASPYTFYLPSVAALQAVRPGMLVKAIFEGVPPSDQFEAERMWVRVTAREGDTLTGTLDNMPNDMPGLSLGAGVTLKLWHVIDTDAPDPDGQNLEIWLSRCFVDKAITEGAAQIGYIYREAPEHEPEDTYPDTGWRLRSDLSQISDEENEALGFHYVAIGVALNKDDSILPYLQAPMGSAFERGPGGAFVEVQRSEP